MKRYFFYALCLFTIACGDDDDTNAPFFQDPARMSIEFDSTNFELNVFSNTLLSAQQANQVSTRLDIRTDIEGGELTLTVAFWDWQDPPVDGIPIKTFDTNSSNNIVGPNTECFADATTTYCDGALGTYNIDNAFYSTAGVPDSLIGTITITANDPVERRVSGAFDFTVSPLAGEEIIPVKGTFSDLEY